MFVYRAVSRVLVHTPAKINLFLEVLARRPDGFHEVETLMGPITIYDTLEFVTRSDEEVRLTCRWAGGIEARGRGDEQFLPGDLPQQESNIVHRAVARLRDRCAARCGADVRLIKRIPSAAGLGGASSDAAAALVAGNLAWNLHWSLSRLADVAAELGSDVPFFLREGWAVCCGRGERIEPQRGGRLHMTVVRPRTGLSTAQVYGKCRPASPAQELSPLAAGLASGNWRAIRQGMANRLEGAAVGLQPEIGTVKHRLQRLGCIATQMSGSGSSCFGICRSARHARRVTTQMSSLGVGAARQATIAGRGRAALSSGTGDVNSAS